LHALFAALAGSVLLWLPAFAFRVDAATCAAWPPPWKGTLCAFAYLAAVALFAYAWLRAQSADWPLGRVLGYGALVHAVAMVAPPFASNDPLFYAAIGRVLAKGGDAHMPLSQFLPGNDHFLALLPDGWRDGTTPYGPVFNQLARLIAQIGGDNVTFQLRLYQGLNLALLVASAALVGIALSARAAALVLFAPLAIIDGTVNPHNDVLVALGFAIFVFLTARRDMTGPLALLATLTVKLSGLILLVFELLRLSLRPLVRRFSLRALVVAGAILAALAVALIVAGLRAAPSMNAFAALVGDPHERSPHFTRSVEALPRAFLTYIVHAPYASWLLGLVCRAAAALVVFYGAVRAAQTRDPLPWAATTLFLYYLFFHAYLQSWYLVPLLPLAGELPARLRAAWSTFVVCLCAYYALALPLDCDLRPVVLGAKEFAEAAIVILPAAFTLLVAWKKGRASAETSPRAA
jgi:hypothetical protein